MAFLLVLTVGRPEERLQGPRLDLRDCGVRRRGLPGHLRLDREQGPGALPLRGVRTRHGSPGQIRFLMVHFFNGAPFNGAPFNGAPFNGAPFNGAPFNGAPFVNKTLLDTT